MAHSADDTQRKEFLRHLRSDLNHLYDPAHLRRSALVDWFRIDDSFDAGFKLQRLLVNAIEELSRQPQSTTNAPLGRLRQHILRDRYVQQLSQADLARCYGLSVRQLRREQSVAIQFLATWLWDTYDLAQWREDREKNAEKAAKETGIGDLGWLAASGEEAVCEPNIILVEVVDLIQPLLERYAVDLELDVEGPLPLLALHPSALQQALLNLLNLLVPLSENEAVRLAATTRGNHVEVQIIRPRYRQEPPVLIGRITHALEMTRQILSLFAAQAQMIEDAQNLVFSLSLPVLDRTPVLVIDDNADFFQLLQRYTAGSRYEIHGIQELGEALERIQEQPGIVLLDIMMPKLDGWELLRKLRSNPATRHVPVIITTILPQQELALALGADDFLQKPITRENLLEVLERNTSRLAPAGR